VKADQSDLSFFARHEFLILRLQSLTGLLPVGAYMTVHLLTNSSVLGGSTMFQNAVYQIHSLGPVLPVVEWLFIFLPILFHAIVGLVIIRSGNINTGAYSYASNVRYTLQRATGMIAFLFIMWHVFHMHGWFHAESWIDNVANNLEGAKFKPYNATSSAGIAMQQSILVVALYAIGVLSCVFHFANGLWTMGITWGLWTTPEAQARANYLSVAVGGVLTIVGLSAIYGFATVDTDAARAEEDRIYQQRVDAGLILPSDEKRFHDEHAHEGVAGDHPSGDHPAEPQTEILTPIADEPEPTHPTPEPAVGIASPSDLPASASDPAGAPVTSEPAPAEPEPADSPASDSSQDSPEPSAAP